MAPSSCEDGSYRNGKEEHKSPTVKANPSKQVTSKESLVKSRESQKGEFNIPDNGVADRKGTAESVVSDQQVSQVIAKTKRAAASLWMILHAQTCTRDPSTCSHQGCRETKQLLIHLKTCSASNGAQCPRGYNGCLQARKLLTHYRKCREIRSKNVGRGPRNQNNPCLLCTLVARHLKNDLDGGQCTFANSSPLSTGRLKANSQFKAYPRKTSLIPNRLPIDRYDQKRSLPGLTRANQSVVPISPLERTSSLEMMPPPPQRPPLRSGKQKQKFHTIPMQGSVFKTDSNAIYGSPPTNAQLMQKGVEAVAKATGPATTIGMSEREMLGKSFDSARGSFLNNRRLSQSDNAILFSPSNQTLSRVGRRRRMSHGELQSQHTIHEEQKEGFSDSHSYSNEGNDPTVEFVLKSQSNIEEGVSTKMAPGRLRSSSCSILTTFTSKGKCETILE